MAATNDETVKHPAPRPSRFVEGYLDDRYAAGHRPTVGYPRTRLPDAAGRTMEVVTCFVGGRPAK